MNKPEQMRADFEFNPQYPGGQQHSRTNKWGWRKIPMGCLLASPSKQK